VLDPSHVLEVEDVHVRQNLFVEVQPIGVETTKSNNSEENPSV